MKKQKRKIQKAIAARKTNAIQPFDPEVIEVVRKTIAPDLTDAEFKVYLGVCRRYQADPVMKDIVPVVFNTKKFGRVLNFIITKNHCLKVAHNSKELDSLTSKIVRNEKGAIIGATATCWKKGSIHPFEVEVDFKEYYNDKNEVWGQFPGAMIQKVAKVVVLKEAFGIDIPSDIETEKNGNRMIQISDIHLPKTKFLVSDDGKVRKERVEEKQEEENEIL